MLVTDRIKLEKEYYKWLKKQSNDFDIEIKDNPYSLITFLDEKGLMKNEC